MKKIILSLTLLSSIVFLNSCLKDKEFTNNEYGLASGDINKSSIVQILAGGLPKFKEQVLVVDGAKLRDTAYFQIFYINNGLPADRDITIKFAISDAQLAAYNARPSDPDFEKFPDSIYSFTKTSVVVRAGQTLSEKVPLIFFPSKIDPAKLYMLPVTITDGAGSIISSNNGTFFFHIIGNPFAVDYIWNFSRWNNADGSGPTAGGTFVGDHTKGQAVTDLTFDLPSGYFIQPRYRISFDANAGVYSNFSVSMNPDDVAALLTNGVTVTDGPRILFVDPINKRFKFQYQVFNGTANRYLIDEYIK